MQNDGMWNIFPTFASVSRHSIDTLWGLKGETHSAPTLDNLLNVTYNYGLVNTVYKKILSKDADKQIKTKVESMKAIMIK